MTSLPKISIVIPVYNVEDYISECLQSVMRQTYKGEIECILVDDCGTDNSIAIAERLIADNVSQFTFCIPHHDHNRGLSAARNTGTDAAKGDYIYYLDSDDYISDDCITVLAKPLQEREYDVIIGDYDMFGDLHYPTLLTEERDEIIGNEKIFASYADRKICIMAWNKLCKKSFLIDNSVTFLEGQLHEDELWTYKMMLSIQSLRICHKEIYFYRIRLNSISTDKTKAQKKLLSYFDTIQYMQTYPSCYTNEYNKCLLYYWNLYLYIAFENRLSFRQEYIKLRNSCPYRLYNVLSDKNNTMGLFKQKLHFAFPPMMAYYGIKAKNYIKSHIL